jgi:hypothetical protein
MTSVHLGLRFKNVIFKSQVNVRQNHSLVFKIVLFFFFLFLVCFLVYKEDMEEMEMEIGCPTDVKHVTHIGWDGCSSATATTSSPVMGWDNLITPDHLLSLPSSSLEPFHLSGPAHAHAHHPATLLNAST